jgi:hypothetical protein
VEAELEWQSQAQESAAAALRADVGALQNWRQSEAAAQDCLEREMKTVTTDVQNGRDGQNGLISAVGQLRADVSTLKSWVFPDLNSTIISDFPDVFAKFRGKHFALLWRGGRDGFGARDFHSRCDGHANTLTLIEDTKGNIFGGFTPVKWESPNGDKCKADPSLKSFLFTHNVAVARSSLLVLNRCIETFS